MKMLQLLLVTLFIYLSAFTLVQAAMEVRVDYGNFQLSGGNWNNVTASFTNVPLIDYNTGLATGITASTGNFAAANNGGFNKDWVTTEAGNDLFFTTAHNAGLTTLANVPAGNYMLEVLFSSSFAPDQYGGTFTLFNLGGTAPDRTFNGTSVADPWNARTDGFDQQNWLIWDEISPDGSGNITLFGSKVPLSFNSLGINALRLTEVIPEPSSYAALFALGAGLFAWRKRRR